LAQRRPQAISHKEEASVTVTASPRQRTAAEKLTVKEILAELKIERSTWNDWRAKRTAPRCIKLPNGQLRVRRDVLDQWIEDREESA
jgi:predicted DNA-binding transcriptional regulator AlpA